MNSIIAVLRDWLILKPIARGLFLFVAGVMLCAAESAADNYEMHWRSQGANQLSEPNACLRTATQAALPEQHLQQELALLRVQHEQSQRAAKAERQRFIAHQSRMNEALETFVAIFQELSLEIDELENTVFNQAQEAASENDLDKLEERTTAIFKRIVERLEQQNSRIAAVEFRSHRCHFEF